MDHLGRLTAGLTTASHVLIVGPPSGRVNKIWDLLRNSVKNVSWLHLLPPRPPDRDTDIDSWQCDVVQCSPITRHHADQHQTNQTYGKTDSLTARVAHMHNVTICTTLLLITLPSCQDLVFWSSSITIYFGLIFNWVINVRQERRWCVGSWTLHLVSCTLCAFTELVKQVKAFPDILWFNQNNNKDRKSFVKNVYFRF